MSRRGFVSRTGLWIGCALLACGCGSALSTQTRTAHYPQGISFLAKGRGDYYSVSWEHAKAKAQPCPLILHLPGGDLTAPELADPKTLLARGWSESFRDKNVVEYAWREVAHGEEKALSQETLIDGALERVLFRVSGGGAVSVDGGRVGLPISEAELERLLGKPVRVEVNDVFQGKVK